MKGTVYFEETNLIADHECQHLYVAGCKGLCRATEKTRCAVRKHREATSGGTKVASHISDEFSDNI